MHYLAIIITILGGAFAAEPESEVFDTLAVSVVSSSAKLVQPLEQLSSPSTSVLYKDFESHGLNSPKLLSSIVPNLHIPDYGTSMTSSIYMRGFGSRIDNPVLGLYIDDIPVLDKNNYEFELMDIRRADLLRGPQGTLFGRNSLTGVLSISTLDPSVISGGKAVLEYGSANTMLAKGSWYGAGLGVSAAYRHSDGFYVNEFDGSDIDKYDSFSLRLTHGKDLNPRLHMDNTLSASWLVQGGYAYRRLVESGEGDPAYGGVLLPVNYNGDSGYRRVSVLGGTKFRYEHDRYQLRSVTSIQLLFDRMNMDQDFTPQSVFTLQQKQKQAAVTQEFIFRPKEDVEWWDSQTGVFAFYRYNYMDAPVNFLYDGVNTLILGNANNGIPDPDYLDFLEDEFLIATDFKIHTYNTAFYHESYFTFGNWHFTAGLRLDHEGNFMRYCSGTELTFIYSPIMKAYEPFETVYKGLERNFYFELLPKLSALYDFGSLNVFATVSKGYKSGGFNTQIFSDILQNKLMEGMMNHIGVHSVDSGEAPEASATCYKPESCFNYEAGLRYSHVSESGHRISASASAFYIDCHNQQITIFPPGKNTGRRMANVGKSRSYGAEAEFSYSYKNFSVNGSYGYVNARFTEYSDGKNDYSGNRIPYSPEQTAFMRASYTLPLSGGIMDSISFSADANCTGRIWWNEDNSYVEPVHVLFGGDITLDFGKFDLYVRGRNLSNRDYNTFYFKSMDNSFFQKAKPVSYTAGIRLNF